VIEIGRTGVEGSAPLGVDEDEAVGRFLALTSWEIEREANRQARRSPSGTTWLSLSSLMQRHGYRIVADLGVPAAISWGVHLGVLPARERVLRLDDTSKTQATVTDPPTQ
jgi:hypothetical protein